MRSVWTDGACSGNPGPGGWAWAVPDGPWAAGAETRTTNQRMEIRAALEAVRALDGPLEVVSDSTYVVNCFRDRWWEGWKRRGWLNSAKKPVANRDLWEPLVDLYLARGDVSFRWVKGHGGDPMNDLVDRLAVEAATTQRGRSGVGTPDRLGPADAPGGAKTRASAGAATGAGARRPSRGPALPEGHLVVVTGLAPPDLGGYGPNPVADRVRERLAEVLAHWSTEHPDLVVLTGLGLGAEQLAAEAALDAGVPYVAVLPFEGYGEVWSGDARQRLDELARGALLQVVLEARTPSTRQQAGMWLRRRDTFLAERAAAAVVVGAGDDEAYRTLAARLGDDAVLLLTP